MQHELFLQGCRNMLTKLNLILWPFLVPRRNSVAVSSVPGLGKLWANTWDNSTDLVAFCDGRNLVDKGRAILVSSAWTCAFGTVPQGVLVSKPERCGVHGWSPQWSRNGLDGGTPGVAVSGSMPSDKGHPRGWGLGLARSSSDSKCQDSPWHCCATLQGSVQGTVQEIVLEPKLLLKPLLKVFGLGC